MKMTNILQVDPIYTQIYYISVIALQIDIWIFVDIRKYTKKLICPCIVIHFVVI